MGNFINCILNNLKNAIKKTIRPQSDTIRTTRENNRSLSVSNNSSSTSPILYHNFRPIDTNDFSQSYNNIRLNYEPIHPLDISISEN